MTYPSVLTNNAIRWWKDWKNLSDDADKIRVEAPEAPEITEKDDGGSHDWDAIISDLVSDLEMKLSKSENNIIFERQAAKIIYQKLPESSALMDPDFWSWMAIVPGLDLILKRYPFSKRSPIPDILNFCKQDSQESLFFRLWIRADISYNSELADPYEFTDYGDVEFWRSHTFRQRYTESWNVFAAFAKFQYPDGPDGKPRLKGKNEVELREFVKALKRSYANINSALMSEEQAYSHLENEWEKIKHKFDETSSEDGSTSKRRWFSFRSKTK